MATTYKTFLNNDIVSNRTLLHESIPITGSILSGTYIGAAGAEENVKSYSHGMFSSVYDYPFLSSSSNHILDITVGHSADSALSQSTGVPSESEQKKKVNIYNQMAQLLMGYDQTGSIEMFDEDGDILAGGTKMKEVFFVNFSRLLTKDEVKKGTFSMTMAMSSTISGNNDLALDRLVLADTNAENAFKINSPAGEYGILYATEHANNYNAALLNVDNGTQKAGLVFYQAGIAVITASIFNHTASNGMLHGDIFNAIPTKGSRLDAGGVMFGTGSASFGVSHEMSSSLISKLTNNFRKRVNNISFNNTTELNSTIYFCRAHHNEFNYSTNPTYLSSSKIVVKNNTLENPVSYITSIGLYSADNELLAVAKLSEPIKKDPQTELTFRVRLDY